MDKVLKVATADAARRVGKPGDSVRQSSPLLTRSAHDDSVSCRIDLYGIKARLRRADLVPPSRLAAGTPALRRWRACAHPHRSPSRRPHVEGGR